MSTPPSAARWDRHYQQRAPLLPLAPAEASLRLVAQTGLVHDAPILDVGCGTSGFLAGLLALRYANLLATDISATALEQHRRQLGDAASQILWLEDDITNQRQVAALQPILLWHDQGLLQEMGTLREQTAYRTLLDYMVQPGGWVILAARAPAAHEPAPTGPPHAYSAEQFAALLGEDYHLRQHFQQPYARLAEPVQPYTYALFERDLHARQGFRSSRLGTH